MTQPSPSSSQSFWAQALEAAETIEPVAVPVQLPPAPPPPPRKRVRFPVSILSPNTSDIEPDEDEDVPGSLVAKRRRMPEVDQHATAIEYLPDRKFIGDDSTHGYLAGEEYSGVNFGDIAGYMHKKNLKVQTQNADIAAAAAASGLPQFFASLTFYINGNTQPPMEELRRMILQRGGKVIPKIQVKTGLDYIIAPVLTLAKFREFKAHKLVREGWITACVEEGRLLDWRKWRLRPDDGEARLDGFLKTGAVMEDDKTATPGEPTREDEQRLYRLPPSIPPPISPFATQSVAVTATQRTPVAATRSLLRQPTMRPTTPVATQSTPVAATQSLIRPPATTQRLPSQAPVQPPPSALAKSPLIDPAIEQNEDAEQAPPAPNPPKPRPEGIWENYAVHKSNRQAGELMKSDAFRARHTSERGNEAGFIDQYYQNSRLHYLSTWKAELRVLVAEARGSVTRVPTVLVPANAERVYLHVDFDAFFVSAGLSSRPHLRGKPVVVCHSSRGGRESTSEIASASYEARAKGVRNGMSLGRARQLVGDELATIPYEFDTYKQHSLKFYTVLLGYADELEAMSVDEALLDATGAVTAIGLAPEEADAISSEPALQLAERIRADIRSATGCEVSIGISHNLLLARLATRKAKPAGVFRLTADDAPDFLASLDVDQLPSVGYSTRAKMKDAFGSTNCADLLSQSRETLRRTLGPKNGETIYGFLRGVDNRRLDPDKERKTVSAEMNYGIRFQNTEQAERYLADLAAEVSKRLKAIGVRGRNMTLKIMVRHPDAPVEPPKFMGHGKCESLAKSGFFRGPTDDAEAIGVESVRLLQSMRLDPTELRGVGIMITKLETGAPKGQAMLSFAPLDKGRTDVETDDTEERSGEERSGEERSGEHSREVTRMPSPVREPHPTASSDHIDPDFLAALPPDLRREVEADHTARRAAKHRRTGPEEVEIPPADKPPVNKSKSKLNAAAHITRQLRPKLKTQLNAKAIAELPLYGAWSRAGSRPRSESVDPGEPIDIGSDSDVEIIEEAAIGGFPPSELRALGIDLDVFAALPEDLQADVVAQERARVQPRLAQSRARPRVSASLSPAAARARNSRSNSAVPPGAPMVYANAVTRPALFRARDTDDVGDVLARWIASAPAPAARDVSRVSGYMVKCVTCGIGGVDHVSVLLRSMSGLLRDRKEAAGEWWGAFDEVKRAVDDVLVQRLGAPLRL